MARTIFLPVGFAEAADRLAALVDRGIVRVQPHWLSREACQSYIDSLPSLLRGRYWPTAAVVQVAGDVGLPCLAIPPAEADRARARVSGKPIAGGAGLTGATALAVPSVSVIERQDAACISSDTRSEAA